MDGLLPQYSDLPNRSCLLLLEGARYWPRGPLLRRLLQVDDAGCVAMRTAAPQTHHRPVEPWQFVLRKLNEGALESAGAVCDYLNAIQNIQTF